MTEDSRDFARAAFDGDKEANIAAVCAYVRAPEGIHLGHRAVCTPSKVAQANEVRDNVERAMDTPPQDYRKVISFSHLVGLSHAEIGEVMGRKAGAVRVLLHRGLRRLETVLKERGMTAWWGHRHPE